MTGCQDGEQIVCDIAPRPQRMMSVLDPLPDTRAVRAIVDEAGKNIGKLIR